MEVKLGLVQMKMVEDRQKNLTTASRMVDAAARGGAQIVCLPELFDVQYHLQYIDDAYRRMGLLAD